MITDFPQKMELSGQSDYLQEAVGKCDGGLDPVVPEEKIIPKQLNTQTVLLSHVPPQDLRLLPQVAETMTGTECFPVSAEHHPVRHQKQSGAQSNMYPTFCWLYRRSFHKYSHERLIKSRCTHHEMWSLHRKMAFIWYNSESCSRD